MSALNLPPAVQSQGPLIHFRWDLDKTYIHTDFDSMRALWATFRQRADEKRNVAGSRVLMRELLARDAESDIPARVTVISGSPRQMHAVLREKLAMDGVEPDAFILKPNLSNILRGRFRAINDQLGYKLSALLRSRVEGDDVREVLFGDDAEQDALIYCLYGDIVSGRVDADRLAGILGGTALYRTDIDEIMALQAQADAARAPRIQRVVIRLDRRSPVSRFAPFGSRVVAVYNYFQAAVVLFGDGLLTPSAVGRVVESMQREGYSLTRLRNSLQDMVRRRWVQSDTLLRLADALDVPDESSRYVGAFRDSIDELRHFERAPREGLPDIDYETLCATAGRYHRTAFGVRGAGILRR